MNVVSSVEGTTLYSPSSLVCILNGRIQAAVMMHRKAYEGTHWIFSERSPILLEAAGGGLLGPVGSE